MSLLIFPKDGKQEISPHISTVAQFFTNLCTAVSLLDRIPSDDRARVLQQYLPTAGAEPAKKRDSSAPAPAPVPSSIMHDYIVGQGYPMENHLVTTQDGYELQVFRIPHGKNNSEATIKTPVLLMHGIIATSQIWVYFPNISLAFDLADSGFDVWMGNLRGNDYSLKNTRFSDQDDRFWDFSFDQHGAYDVPATIDVILNKTNQPQLFYVGHSMGTTSAFALLSTKVKYQSKIKGLFALAPIATMNYTTTPLRELLNVVTAGIGRYVIPQPLFTADIDTRSTLISYICSSNNVVCSSLLNFVGLWGIGVVNSDLLSSLRIFQTTAEGSTKQGFHYTELAASNSFHRYDYGTVNNYIHYRQRSPPVYNVSKINVPVHLFWGDDDPFADPLDVAILSSTLPNVVLNYEVPLITYAHADFFQSVDNNVVLNPQIKEAMLALVS